MSAGRKIAGGSGGGSGGGAGGGTNLTQLLGTTHQEMKAQFSTDWIDARAFNSLSLIIRWEVLFGNGGNGSTNLLYHAVRAATVAALPACTGSGTGASHILTANANGALPAIDGVTLTVGQDFLVKNQVATKDNGIYTVLDVGSAGTPWIIGRANNFQAASPSEITFGAYVLPTGGGTVNLYHPFVVTSIVFTVDTDAITFSAGDPLGFLYIEICEDPLSLLKTILTMSFDSPDGSTSVGVPYETEAIGISPFPYGFFRVTYVPIDPLIVPRNGWLTIEGIGKG